MYLYIFVSVSLPAHTIELAYSWEGESSGVCTAISLNGWNEDDEPATRRAKLGPIQSNWKLNKYMHEIF